MPSESVEAATSPGPGIRELVEKARAGCDDSFGRLAAIYGPRLTILIRLELGPGLRSRVNPDDVLQTVLIKAWQALPRLEWQNENAFYKWLATIAARSVVDSARETRKDDEVLSLEALTLSKSWVAAISSRSSSAGGELIREERFHRLENALGKLRPEDRRIVILARLRGLSMAEIAAELACTVGAASMRLLRALRALRAAFGDTGSYRLPPWSLDPGP